jgi:hypothetical protein
MIHGAALGNKGDADAAALLAAGIDNPLLHQEFPVSVTPDAPGTSRYGAARDQNTCTSKSPVDGSGSP